jgi:hypothetical protein
MQRQSWTVLSFALMLLSVIWLSNNPWASQLDSNKPAPASEDQTSVAHASCGIQATEVLILGTPGSSSPIARVKCDEDVTIIYDEVGFYKVQLGNGTQGYISQLFVTNPKQKASVRDGGHEGIARVGKSGISPPTYSHCPDPEFTAEARSAKYQGTVVLEAIITTEGKVTYVRAVQVTTLDKRVVGTPSLDRAWVSLEETAIDSVKRWRLKPAHRTDGEPVAVLVPIQITFRLVN